MATRTRLTTRCSRYRARLRPDTLHDRSSFAFACVGTRYLLTFEREENPMAVEIWAYREEFTDLDLGDFQVLATDGEIGKVDEATYETGNGLIIVDTGPWILGKKVMLPAGTIER